MLNDVRITIFNSTFGSVLDRDVSNRTTAVTYENAPDGCRGAAISTDLLWEEVFDQGIYQGRNGIEISTGDDLLNVDFAGPRTDGTARLYVSSTAPYDVGKTGCNGQIYLWDGSILTMGIPVLGVGVEPGGQPYIEVGPPPAWPGNPTSIPAYSASATIVGRRVYAGRIAGRNRENARDKKMTYSCVGMTSRLNERNITYTFNVYDIGAAIYHCVQQITWGDLYVDPLNFPVVGQTYSGTGTNSSVLSAIMGALAANSTGDVWVVRVGHDRAPRLLNLYRGASNTYTVTTTFDQSTARLGATAVTSRDEDTSKMFNSILVNGDTDQVTGQPYGAIAQDNLSISTYQQIDAPPVSNTSLKSNDACYALAKTLLNEQAIPVASNSCVIYARNDGPVGETGSPTGLANGDRVYGIECVQIVGFEGNSTPTLFGIPMSVVTAIPRASSGERMQTITFQAVEPDWNAEVRERVNGAKHAVIANTQTPANLGQFCVSAEAFPPTYVGLSFSPPLFLAQFSVGTQVVPVGNNGPIAVVGSATNYAWINPNNTWTIKQDPSPVAGAILYGFFSADATHIVGFFARAPVGTFKIGVGNINNGHQVAPTFAQAGVVTAAPSFSTIDSDVLLQVWPNNVPQDGSVAGLAFFFRKGGSSPGPWVPYDEVTINPPAPAAYPTSGPGISFTMGQLLNSQTYDFACCYAGVQGYGALSIISTGFVAVNIAINTNYLLNTTTLPAFNGTPQIIESASSAISSTVQVNWNFSNQPSNGDTGKVNTFYRVVGDYYWSYYGALAVIQWGGTYVAKFQDVTNGVAYEFGTSLESTGRAESSVVSLGTYTTIALDVVNSANLAMPVKLLTYGPNITALTYVGPQRSGSGIALQDIQFTVPVADRNSGSAAWFDSYVAYVRDDSTQKLIGGAPTRLTQTATAGTYIGTIAIPAGLTINTGLALLDNAGNTSHVAWDGSGLTAGAIGSPFILGGTSAPAPNVSSSPAPTFTPSASANGLNAAETVGFTLDNQPTDGSLHSIAIFYKDVNAFGWSYYGSVDAVGVGSKTPPSSGAYSIILLMLNAGITYQFGCRYVSVNGSTTSYTVAIGTMSGAATVQVPLGTSTGTVPYGNNTGSVTNVVTNTGSFGSGAYQNASGSFPTAAGGATPQTGYASIWLPAGTWFVRCDWAFNGNNNRSAIGNYSAFSNFISSVDSAGDQNSSLAVVATGTITGQQTAQFQLQLTYSGAGTAYTQAGVWVVSAFRIA